MDGGYEDLGLCPEGALKMSKHGKGLGSQGQGKASTPPTTSDKQSATPRSTSTKVGTK